MVPNGTKHEATVLHNTSNAPVGSHRVPAADIISYNSTMHVLANARQWQVAFALLSQLSRANVDDMLPRGPRGVVSPNIITYNTALSALTRAHQWALAYKLLERLQKRRDVGSDVAPDIYL
eukprot:GEMP01062035.1.p2 GENE.GEMP01062035.1~~GEMP01062035.1.p2  ORF type:complete len:121 (+),score=28.13 GEMP01062035.1:154-516(+)